jgi:hypothetical protein
VYPPNETPTYDLARLDFVVVAGSAVLMIGLMLVYIWRVFK